MKTKWLKRLAVGSLWLALAGCGGGGGDAGPIFSSNDFPLQAGYRALIATGSTTSFTVSGDCGGTASLTMAPAAPATFEGVAGFAASGTATINLTGCSPASGTVSGTDYFDASYTPLGSSTTGEEYARFATLPQPLPASVEVGDTGSIGTYALFTDSSKTVVTGSRVLSYVIEPDTQTTAIVNLIALDHDTTATLIFTEQSRYRMAADGTLTPLSVELESHEPGGLHVVLTRR